MQYYGNEPFLDNNSVIADFAVGNNSSASFKFKTQIAGRTGNDCIKNAKIRVPVKYLSNF